MARTGGDSNGPFDPSTLDGPSIRPKRDVPDGLWMRCPGCEDMVYRKVVQENLDVCPKCEHHFRIKASRRIELLTDPDSFEELFANIAPADPLNFTWAGKTFAERITAEQRKTGNTEAVLTGIAYIKGRRVALGAMDPEWLTGTMGCVVGEKISLIAEKAAESEIPLVIVSASGGARMHEGALSVMQMAKTAAALAKLDDAGGLYLSVLTEPTYGGTTASFSMLGDVIIAEPGAMIGFAGERVIANTIKAELPEGFQRAEFLMEHGFVDRIVPRGELRNEIAQFIDYFTM